MPAPKVPTGLAPEKVQIYNDLYDALGQQAADDYASSQGVAVTPTPPAPTPVTAPTPAPVTLQIVTDPSGRPSVRPVGAEPPVVSLPEPRVQLQDRPGVPALRMTQDELAESAIKVRTINNQKRGMVYDDARKEAEEYVAKARETPRTVEFKAKPVPGYSELAVRGEELLPKLSAGEATLEAIKPQVLETAEQAEGRKRFERAKRDAKARIEAEAKTAGKSYDAYVQDLLVGNAVRAGQIAEQVARDKGQTQVLMKDINDIKAQLDAPYYAALDELKGVPPNEVVSRWATNTLRGLTQEERYGRLVETRGAATLRNIGGLTRYGVGAMEEYIAEPLAKAAVAAFDPNVTYSDLTRIEKEEIEAAGGARREAGPGVTYKPGFEARNKLETDSFLKDTAYEIATGRSTIDDYIDTGVPVPVATVLGLATEIAIPATPFGYVSDVAPIIGRAAAKVPVVGAVPRSLGRLASRVGDIPEAIRLTRYIGDQVETAQDLGRAMDNPGFMKTWSNVSDARVALATKIAEDSADLAATAKALRGGDAGITTIATRVADIIDGSSAGTTTTRKIAADLYDEIVTKGGGTDADLIAALRNPDAATIAAVKKYADETVTPAVQKVTSKEAPDIVRNTFAKARATINNYNDNITDVVRASVAETLEKVPNSQYMFVTPRLLVKKSIINDKAMQKSLSDAVKALPRNASIDDVTKAVEDTIKRELNGRNLGDMAEPVAVRPPREEGLLPQAPRGGLERIATPAARRVTGIEAFQDVRDTLSALSPKLGKLASETFAGSQQLQAVGRTLDNALEARIPIQVRDFAATTKSEIDALTIMQVPTRTPAAIVPGAARESRGIILNAIRNQGDDGLNIYLAARIEANADDPLKLRASRVDGPVGTKLWEDIDESAKVEATTSIVRSYFKGSIEALTDPDVVQVVNRAIAAGVKDSPDAITAVTSAISEVRTAFPELVGAGRRGVGLAFREDDVASAILDYIIKQEAKVIFAENFFKYFPDLKFNTKGFADNVRTTVSNRLDAYVAMNPYGTIASNARKARDIVENFAKLDVNKEELARAAVSIVNRELGNGVVDFSNLSSLVGWGPNTRKMLAEVNQLGDPMITNQVIQGIMDVTKPHTLALSDFLYQNKVIRPVTEQDVVTLMADNIFIPMPQSQKAVIEALIGPISDLSKGTGAIADNLSAIYRNPGSGLGDTFSTLFKSFVDTVRTTSVPGLTAGVIVPNIKFHAINYFSAPLIMSVTSPGLATKAALGELSRFIPIRSWQETNLNFTRQMAKTNPDQIAFTSANGIPYTYGQLDTYMNDNYFGMTEQVFAFGNKFGEDVRIELGVSHAGTPVAGLDKARDKVQNYLNIAGTGQYVKVASSIDTAWRQQAFLAALKSGETLDGARRVAQNAVLDYGRIPSSARQFASRYMTFFSWFAVSNAEVFSALFRPAAAANISKMVRAQRELHRGFGEWQYADDGMKKRMFSVAIGNYDELPAYFVGPENPWAGPLIDQTSLLLGLYSIMAGETNGEDAVAGLSNAIVEKSFTPFLGYLSDIGALGESGALGKVVPARQVAFHRAMGDEHFAAWMAENNITTVPIGERRLGEPTFYGQQYMYADEGSRKRAAAMDLLYTYMGISRAINDYQAMGLILTQGPTGTDPKRFENQFLGMLQYFTGGNLQKGTTQHEQVRSSIISANSEIRKMGEE